MCQVDLSDCEMANIANKAIAARNREVTKFGVRLRFWITFLIGCKTSCVLLQTIKILAERFELFAQSSGAAVILKRFNNLLFSLLCCVEPAQLMCVLNIVFPNLSFLFAVIITHS